MKITKKIFYLLPLFCFLIFSCGKKSFTKDYAQIQEAPMYMAAPAPRAMKQIASSAKMQVASMPQERLIVNETNGKSKSAGTLDTEGATDTADIERKLIKTGNINVQVQDLLKTQETALQKCKEYQGYIASSSKNQDSVFLQMRIPATVFDKAVQDLCALGKLNDCNINAQDVTDNFYDLESRLATKKVLFERLQSYLKTATNMKDLLSIEAQLNQVQSDIESMQGQFKRLNNQIDYSTISVTFCLPHNTTQQGYKWPPVLTKLKDFFFSAVNFFSSLLVVILGLFIFGVPVVLLLAFIYWLSFGKLGLVKKLFCKLHG